MDLLRIITVALLLIVAVAVGGWLNGESRYIAWGAGVAAATLLAYMALIRWY